MNDGNFYQPRKSQETKTRHPKSKESRYCAVSDGERCVRYTDSVDLRLGAYFLLPQVPPLPFTAFDAEAATTAHLRVHIPWGSTLLSPHTKPYWATIEFIKIPADVSGQILTKSTVARAFVVIETTPWIHPVISRVFDP